MSTSTDFDAETNNSAGGNSFWDVKQYIRTTKRLENANKLCTDLCNMIQDRVEIEKTYSSSLRKWSVKWNSYLENGSEYGSTKQCWMGFCREAENMSELHKEVRERLIDEAQTEVRSWQREHFHKTTLPPQNIKESKALESDFELAQKAWNKKLKKMHHARKDYHQQCKMVRSYDVQSRNAANDSGVSQEQVKKLEERLMKAQNDMKKLQTHYEASIQDLTGDSGRYVEEMTKVFNKAQDMEKERMEFFKSIFQRIRKILNFSEDKRLCDIYGDFNETINALDSQGDVNFWSQVYGAEMPFNIPQFEEYTQDLHSITKKRIGGGGVGSDSTQPVTLTAMTPTSRQGSLRGSSCGGDASNQSHCRTSSLAANSASSNEPQPSSQELTSATAMAVSNTDGPPTSCPPSPAVEMRNAGAACPETVEPPLKPRRSSSSAATVMPISSPSQRHDPVVIGDGCCVVAVCEDTEDNKNCAVQLEGSVHGIEDVNHNSGVQVRSLYDYTGLEEDELTLIQGEIFLKLEDEDEQGWCKGRKNGVVGLYPANYAEPLP